MAAGQIDVPAMDRPSVAFAWFLDSMEVSRNDEVVFLECGLCREHVCDIESGDDLRVLLNTALAHNCKAGK